MNNSYKGKILISTPDISGDIFSRSVVLIIEMLMVLLDLF